MKTDQKSGRQNWAGLFLPAGIGLGTGAGALMGNIGLGMIFGVAVGTILSLLIGYWLAGKDEA